MLKARLMTYNVRVDAPEDVGWGWKERAPYILKIIQCVSPDVFILNEVTPEMLSSILPLESYRHVSMPRENGETIGESVSIFWKIQRFEKISSSAEWISRTPDVPSLFEDSAYKRTIQEIVLRDMQQCKEVQIIGTQFDHQSTAGQEQGVKQIEKISNPLLPIIIAGDFNLTPDSSIYRRITKTFLDSKERAIIKRDDFNGTFQASPTFTPSLNRKVRRIDYFFSDKSIKITSYSVIGTTAANGLYPSDHFPVVIEIEI